MRIPKKARDLLLQMMRCGQPVPDIGFPQMGELRRRRLVQQVDIAVEITPNGARKVESYALTERGKQVALQLLRETAS